MLSVSTILDRTDDPPNIPAITGVTPKKEKSCLAEVISGAATTLAQALKPQVSVSAANTSMIVNHTTPPKVAASSLIGISPVRSTELRSKKLQELRELQQLLEGNVINAEEFAEQKAIVLDSLRKLV